MSRFTYQLTYDQYCRFVNDPNTTGEIDNLGRLLGVDIKDGPFRGTTWVFTGKCEGSAKLVDINSVLYGIVIDVNKKPWYLFDWVLDWGFKKALK